MLILALNATQKTLGKEINMIQPQQKFEIGNVVRYLGNENNVGTSSGANRLAIGSAYTVKSIGFNERFGTQEVTIEEVDTNSSITQECFNLVSKGNRELLELIRISNEGDKAYKTLREKYPNDFEVCYDDIWESFEADTGSSKYTYSNGTRLKEKVEPFKIGHGWTVNIDGHDVTIGCESYLREHLASDLEFAMTSGRGENYKIISTRYGLKQGSNSISWDEADNLLAALKKAGRK